MKAIVTVMLKDGVLDPQGEAVRSALGSMGFAGVEGVRQGK
ncbi:MAG: phosphoribosylformylglycinamidine synthase subunit PurS, partial [Shimia sp.]